MNFHGAFLLLVAVIHTNLVLDQATPIRPSLPNPPTILPDLHLRNLLSSPFPPPTHPNITSTRSQPGNTEVEHSLELRDPLSLDNDDARPVLHRTTIVEEEGKAQCPICFKFYKNRSSLKVHKSVYHRKGTTFGILDQSL